MTWRWLVNFSMRRRVRLLDLLSLLHKSHRYKAWCLVSIRSSRSVPPPHQISVMPGQTSSVLQPCLEMRSHQQLGQASSAPMLSPLVPQSSGLSPQRMVRSRYGSTMVLDLIWSSSTKPLFGRKCLRGNDEPLRSQYDAPKLSSGL